jgi:hypothetical protein
MTGAFSRAGTRPLGGTLMIDKVLCSLRWHRWSDSSPESRHCMRCGTNHPDVAQHLLRLLEEKTREAAGRKAP